MGHVLGIGTLWSASNATGGAIPFGTNQELYVNNSGQYTGAFGLAAYNSEFNQAGTSVPIELGGGPAPQTDTGTKPMAAARTRASFQTDR